MGKAFQTVSTNNQGYDFAGYYSIGKNWLSLLLNFFYVTSSSIFYNKSFAIKKKIISFCEKLTLKFAKAERQSGINDSTSRRGFILGGFGGVSKNW
jgi:hypothetical protein